MEEIIKILLAKMEGNPNASVENLLQDFCVEMNLTNEDLDEMKEVFCTLDAINSNAVDLAKKKESGLTRNGWIEQRISNMSETSAEDAEEVISQIVEGVKTGINDTISQEV